MSESGTRGLRRLEVVRNKKVPVDQAQVQQTLDECGNHFNKIPENQSAEHPESWDYQPPLYTVFCIKDSFMPMRWILQELKPNDGPKRKAFALEMLSRIDYAG